jgi:hypothetical protein
VDNLDAKFDTFIDKLENKFVLRWEFKVAIAVIWAIWTVVGVIMYFK